MMLSKAERDQAIELLEQTYPDAKPQLLFRNAFELLIATILSAQCTDKRVNICTRELFENFHTPGDIAKLTPGELEPLIKSCGLYQTKAKNIVATCKILEAEYDGQVPAEMDKLRSLPGVGRKTANVVMSNAFGIPAIAVDTHVFRVANRIGLAEAKNVLETEKQLMNNIPKMKWSQAHHWLIYHGRQICAARNPKCDQCTLKDVCAERKYTCNLSIKCGS